VITATTFRDIVSGRRRDVASAVLRAGFAAASVPYGWVIRRRNRRYDRGDAEIVSPAVPVISVGNLTVGGTGKTPMVEWIARWAAACGVRAAILSRGYGARAEGGRNDEALELAWALPDVLQLQNPDRAAAAEVAVKEHRAQLLLLDDGFQHRRLARDLDIVLLDASQPFGFDRLLPRGMLREPPEGLRRAHVVALSRADMLDAPARDTVRRRVEALNPQAAWCEVEHRPAALLSAFGESAPLEALAGKNVVAFCGIGNPAGFRHTLAGMGCRAAAWREFPDHHDYTRDDVAALGKLVQSTAAAAVACTRKDLVKLRVQTIAGAPLRAVGVELQFLKGKELLMRALEPLAAQALKATLPKTDSGSGL
jgi:tetraacyldisaccharide 4'-kinase